MPRALGERPLLVNENPKPSHMRRMLDLLELASLPTGGPLTLTNISSSAQIPISTTSRLLSQLVSWGYLTIDEGGRYLPGPRLVRMSVTIASELHTPEMLFKSTSVLSADTGESVTAGMLVHDTIIIVARTESQHVLRAVTRIGELIPPGSSALGKAVLSNLPYNRRLRMLEAAGVEDPASDLQNLESELRVTSSKQYAVDEETYSAGLRCRAVAILGPNGVAVGGLSISGPAARFTKETAERAVPLLLHEAKLLSFNLDPPMSRVRARFSDFGSATFFGRV